MTTELKPCPLCGSTDVVAETISEGNCWGDWMVRCLHCGIELRAFPQKETLVMRWNERGDDLDSEPLAYLVFVHEEDCEYRVFANLDEAATEAITNNEDEVIPLFAKRGDGEPDSGG